MERYTNSGGDSGVSAYEIGSDYIIVKFSDSTRTYRYSYRKAGQNHVENLKQLAQSGNGLNSYVNKHVKNLYDK
jgi:macrodomain Ter protein organizer (MatP/YcbG family)